MSSNDNNYRILADHEILREGDERSLTGDGAHGWYTTYTPGVRVSDASARIWGLNYRRRVRWQSPGWRYLDVGEHAGVGVEYLYRGADTWSDRIPRAVLNPDVTSEVYSNILFRVRHPSIAQVTEPKQILCGCGHHSFSEGADPYLAHRTWQEFRPQGFIESPVDFENATWWAKGIGISKPQIEVGYQLQSPDAEDL